MFHSGFKLNVESVEWEAMLRFLNELLLIRSSLANPLIAEALKEGLKFPSIFVPAEMVK
jgi:hypothetical protein